MTNLFGIKELRSTRPETYYGYTVKINNIHSYNLFIRSEALLTEIKLETLIVIVYYYSCISSVTVEIVDI